MIKGVLFDFGGVLSEAGRTGSIRRIFDVVYGLDLSALEIDDIFQKMWRGQIGDEEFLAEIKLRHPETAVVSADEFRSHMDAFEKSKPVYAFAADLRKQGIKTGILSNVFGIGVGPLRAGGFYDGFDPVILSCDVGLAKPDRAIYELAAERLQLRPQEIIFINDYQAWLDPAAALGMHTVLAVSPEQIVTDALRIIDAQANE